MSWFYLAIICALSLALADAYTKKYFLNNHGIDILLVRFSLPGIVLLPFTLSFSIADLPSAFFHHMLLLVPLEITAMWLYVVAIRDAPLHLTLPYLAFTPVFNILTGYLVLGEVISLKGCAGILLIVIGGYLLNLDQLKKVDSHIFSPFTAIYKLKGSRLMLIAAAIYSLTSVIGKRAMSDLPPEIFGSYYYIIVGMTLLLAVLITQPKRLQLITKQPKRNMVVGGLMAIMAITHFLAIAQVEVAYMIAVKRTSLIFGMLLGAWMFKDMITRQHMLAGILMITGVFFILI